MTRVVSGLIVACGSERPGQTRGQGDVAALLLRGEHYAIQDDVLALALGVQSAWLGPHPRSRHRA